ncbi:MAG: TatD family hydrolase [Candidatus Micrarchaeia archaeon]|jgi:TatD DNase family protein
MLDAHCHLDSFQYLEAHLESWLSQLSGFITCGYDLKSSIKNVELAQAHKGVAWAVAGLAPQIAMKASDTQLSEVLEFIRANAAAGKIVAVGEIGLDYKWAKTDAEKKLQLIAFEAQLELAKELNLPVVIHSRDAEEKCISLPIEMHLEKVMQHCFSGSAVLAKQAAEAGHYISIPPLHSKERKKVIKEVTLDLLLAESDAPAIGKEPIAALESASMIAEIKGEDAEAVKLALEKNCRKLFSI